MNRAYKLSLSAFVIASAVLIIYALIFRQCMFNEKSAFDEVERFLVGKGLDSKYAYLTFSKELACEYSFKYEHNGRRIKIIVSDSRRDGAWLKYWVSIHEES